MKKLLFSILLALVCVVTARATDVVVSNTTSSQIPFNPTSLGSSRTITVAVTSASATVTSSAAFPTTIVGKSGFTVTIGGVYYTVAGVASTSSLTLTTSYASTTGSATMVLFPYTLLRAYPTAGFQSNTSTSSAVTVSVTNGSQTVTSSAAFPTMYIGVAGGFQVLIGSTSYQVLWVASTSSLTLATPFGGSTGSTTLTFNGVAQNVQPSTPGSGQWYKEVAVSLVNTGAGNVLYFPPFVIPATTDALVNNQSSYVFGYYPPGGGTALALYFCGSVNQLAIPTSTPTTWTAICNYNSPGGVVPPAQEAYTKSQIDQRFPSCTSGQMIYYAATGNIQQCLTVGSGLTITAGAISASGGGSGITGSLTTNYVPYATGATTIADTNLLYSIASSLFQFGYSVDIQAAGQSQLTFETDQIIFKGGVSRANNAVMQTMKATATQSGAFLRFTNSTGTGLFQVDIDGDVYPRNVVYAWPSANATGVLTNNGSGTLTWSTAASSLPQATQTSISYTALTSDWLISVDATSASRTVTLYAASGNNNRLVSVCKVDTSVNTVVISDGTTLATIYAPEACVQMMSNGSAWKIQSY